MGAGKAASFISRKFRGKGPISKAVASELKSAAPFLESPLKCRGTRKRVSTEAKKMANAEKAFAKKYAKVIGRRKNLLKKLRARYAKGVISQGVYREAAKWAKRDFLQRTAGYEGILSGVDSHLQAKGLRGKKVNAADFLETLEGFMDSSKRIAKARADEVASRGINNKPRAGVLSPAVWGMLELENLLGIRLGAVETMKKRVNRRK